MAHRGIPTFYLYGEPHQQVDESFVHLETVDERSRPSEWAIDPHSHAELAHIFLVKAGGGVMDVDGQQLRFTAPCLLLVPAMAVHSFEWLDDTAGVVLTMAVRYIAEICRHDRDLADLFASPACIPLEPEDHSEARYVFGRLRQELSWSAPGHRVAVTGMMSTLLVLALRMRKTEQPSAYISRSHAATVARLRERIEQHYQLREPISIYATALGLSETALRTACIQVAGSSPTQMLDHRAILEAKRSLLYSDLAVAQIGFSIGFADPAYFSRFFRRHVGLSPRRYRENVRGRQAANHASQ